MKTNLLKNKKNLVMAAVILILIFVAVYFFQRPLAKVGDISLYKQDAEFRDQIILLDSPDEKRSLGLFQLMKSAYNEQILKNNGYTVQPTQVLTEEERINKATKDPEKLSKIKAIFKNDMEAYRRVFVKPTFVDKVIYYDFFVSDEKIHVESLKQAMDFISGYDSKTKFSEYANSKKVKYQNLTVSLKKGLIWEVPNSEESSPNNAPIRMDSLSVKAKDKNGKVINQQNQAGIQGERNLEVFNRLRPQFENMDAQKIEEAQKWVDSIIDKMAVGQILGSPISREDAWLALFYVAKKSDTDFDLQVVTFPKVNFSDWLAQEKKKIDVKVYNKSLLVP